MVKTGTARSNGTVSVRRSLAIGDALCALVVADRLVKSGMRVIYQTHPSFHDLFRWYSGVQYLGPSGTADIDLDQSYEKDPHRKSKHFHQMFFERAARYDPILFKEPRNCRPNLKAPKASMDVILENLKAHRRPWIFICPRSNSYRTRQVNDGEWLKISKLLPGTCFWMGTMPSPPGIVDLRVRRIVDIGVTLSVADLLVTVDTGPMHVAAALGIPMVVIGQSSDPNLHLNDQNDFTTVYPKLDCLNCQKNICPIENFMPPCQKIEPEVVAEEVKRKLFTQTSCVIPILRPPAERLQRCLDSVSGQVNEIIITGEGGSVLPDVKLPPNAIFVQKNHHGVGFGRNVNYGFRQSAGKYVLILNDDMTMMDGAVKHLMEEMRPEVGLIGHLIRYPTGKIYHGGVARQSGASDWGHIDHNKWDNSIKVPCEMEMVTGASILVRRKAFYDAGGFDEDFFLYCEDNDLCMKIRQKGWKVAYTPLAQGTHLSMQTSRLFPNVMDLMAQSQMLFHKKWDWYLRKNINNRMGTF